MTKLWQQEVKKAEKRAEKEREEKEAQLKRAEDARKIVIKLDPELPAATRTKISGGTALRGSRVEVRDCNCNLGCSIPNT